jgi:hypothetical protein
VHRPPGELLKLGLPDDLVIGLIIAPDLILGLPVAGGEQGNNLVPATPDLVRRGAFGIAHGLPYGIAVRSHGKILMGILLRSITLFLLHHDHPCTTKKYMAVSTATPITMSVRFNGPLIQGWRESSNIFSSIILVARSV